MHIYANIIGVSLMKCYTFENFPEIRPEMEISPENNIKSTNVRAPIYI